MKKSGIFYGWIIVAAGCLIMATTMGIVFNTNSLFIKPISEDLGISRQAASTLISLVNMGSMTASFFAGRIFSENNIIKVMRVSIIVIVIAYFSYSLASNIWLLYILHLINGAAECLVTTLPLTFLINNWFKDRSGYALGLASMGSGFGGSLFSYLAGRFLSAYGWRMTYRILDLFILVIAVPCVFFLLKLRPEDMGMEPYREAHKRDSSPSETETDGYTFEEARKKPVFWMLAVCAVLIGIFMNGMNSSVSPRLQDCGYSLNFSAGFLSISMLALAFAKIALGRIFDRYGVRVGYCLACTALTMSMTGLLFCRFPPALVLILAGIAFGFIFGAVVYPLSIPMVFGRKDFKKILGPYASMLALGGMFGPVLSGRVYDMTGSYQMFYIIGIIFIASIVIIMFKALPSSDRQFH